MTVHGISVAEHDPQLLERAVRDIAGQVLHEHQPTSKLDADCVRVDARFVGTGYGVPTDVTLEAVGLLARTEGVLVDPVYSGKALGALIEQIRAGEYSGTADIVFIHTGGSASLPVYDNVL